MKIFAIFLFVVLYSVIGYALEPAEILVIANKDITESERIAQCYCQKRKVPNENILYLSLGPQLCDFISRAEYEEYIAEPVRNELLARENSGGIRCLLTIYGVPIKVGKRGQLPDLQDKLNQLQELARREKNAMERLKQNGLSESAVYQQRSHRLAQLQQNIDRITGQETDASVDSELSMVLFGPYELYRWQPNTLKNSVEETAFRTLMVCRLDGPSPAIAEGLIDKAIAAEQTALKGIAYVDSRGKVGKDLYGRYDQSLRDLALLIRLRTDMQVEQEQTEQLFAPGTCPQTAIYCGWYSLRKYVDAFDFVDGAIGYHISSFEAMDLRDPNSSQWCPAMLRDGITVTLGAVAEPYLHSFPKPKDFFLHLLDGACVVEAYYHTKPFNSWRLILIGDPLYRPFKKN